MTIVKSENNNREVPLKMMRTVELKEDVSAMADIDLEKPIRTKDGTSRIYRKGEREQLAKYLIGTIEMDNEYLNWFVNEAIDQKLERVSGADLNRIIDSIADLGMDNYNRTDRGNAARLKKEHLKKLYRYLEKQ